MMGSACLRQERSPATPGLRVPEGKGRHRHPSSSRSLPHPHHNDIQHREGSCHAGSGRGSPPAYHHRPQLIFTLDGSVKTHLPHAALRPDGPPDGIGSHTTGDRYCLPGPPVRLVRVFRTPPCRRGARHHVSGRRDRGRKPVHPALTVTTGENRRSAQQSSPRALVAGRFQGHRGQIVRSALVKAVNQGFPMSPRRPARSSLTRFHTEAAARHRQTRAASETGIGGALRQLQPSGTITNPLLER